MKRPRPKKDEEPKKLRMVGVWWQTETNSGFEGRFVEGTLPHPEDVERGTNQLGTWLALERYQRRTTRVRGESCAC